VSSNQQKAEVNVHYVSSLVQFILVCWLHCTSHLQQGLSLLPAKARMHHKGEGLVLHWQFLAIPW